MTRREDIESISTVAPNCFETDREEAWYDIGCLDGLAAADEEPNLERLWHDAGEEPKFLKWFLAQIGDNVFDTFVISKNQNWKEWANGINIKRWAYIDNLLPKGGEE